MATFERSTEGLRIQQFVAEGVSYVNQTIQLLRPKAGGPRAVDSIERMYADAEITLFRSLTAQTKQAFVNATKTSTTRFNELSDQISRNLSRQHELQLQSDVANQDINRIEQELNAQVKQSNILESQLAHANSQVENSLEQVRRAKREINRRENTALATHVASMALFIFVPIVGFAAAAINMAALHSSLDTANNTLSRTQHEAQRSAEVLKSTKSGIQTLQSQMSEAESRRAARQVEMSSIAQQIRELRSTRDQLVVVKAAVMECSHTVESALCSAKVLDHLMSLRNFASAVKGLAAALKTGNAFAGELMRLDDAGFKELDSAISRIHQQIRNRLRL